MKRLLLMLGLVWISATAYAETYILVLCGQEQSGTLIRFNLSKPIAQYDNQGISGFVLPSGVNIQSTPYPTCTEALAAVPSDFTKIQIPEKAGNGTQYLFQKKAAMQETA